MSISLLDKLTKAGTLDSTIFSKSEIFNSDIIETNLPILNIALSGSPHGGFTSGATVLAGQSKSFKTMLALYMLKSYFKRYGDDAVCIFYDTEFGSKPAYFKSAGINPDKVIHVPVTNVEALRSDAVNRFEMIDRKDKVFVMVDSLGNIASSKEIQDAKDEKSVADMSRAKQLKSFWRIINPYLHIKDIPFVAINHTYKEMSLFPKDVVSGGTGGIYNPDNIFIITKSQEKDGNDLIGWNFNINIEKSRAIREKSKLSFLVKYEGGIEKWSGLMDMALDAELVVKPSNGWYSKVDPETGEIEEKKYRMKDTFNKDFWQSIIESEAFDKYLSTNYRLESPIEKEDEYNETVKESESDVEEIDLNND